MDIQWKSLFICYHCQTEGGGCDFVSTNTNNKTEIGLKKLYSLQYWHLLKMSLKSDMLVHGWNKKVNKVEIYTSLCFAWSSCKVAVLNWEDPLY